MPQLGFIRVVLFLAPKWEIAGFCLTVQTSQEAKGKFIAKVFRRIQRAEEILKIAPPIEACSVTCANKGS